MVSPLISVVIPTYNRWPLVLESVESVLAQSFRDFEVVVVDDDSPDGTAERLRDIDPSVRVVAQTQPPQPPDPSPEDGRSRSGLGRRGGARNQGIREARGEYVAFLDDDDLYEPWHLAQFAEELERGVDGDQVFASRGWLWDPGSGQKHEIGAFDPRGLARTTLTGTVIPQVVLIASRTALLEVGGFPEDPDLDGSEDWLLMMKLAARYRLHPLPRPSVRIRLHLGRSMNDWRRIIESRDAVTHLVAEEGLLGRELDGDSLRLLRAGTHRFCAGHLYVAGEMAAARRRLGEARRIIGWREGIPWLGRLWLQTWMGPRFSVEVRRIKQKLTWRS